MSEIARRELLEWFDGREWTAVRVIFDRQASLGHDCRDTRRDLRSLLSRQQLERREKGGSPFTVEIRRA